ncbi:MAG: electron transfer flavoprotein subunit alpha/FixB family protein [Acidobacteriota bacterium]
MILVFIEQREGRIKKSSIEVLSKSIRLKRGEVNSIIIGNNLKDSINDLKKFCEKIYVYDDPFFEKYSSLYSDIIVDLAKRLTPEAIFFSATSLGKDLAPRVAANLNVSIASDCIEIKWESDILYIKRPIYAGKAFALVNFLKKPYIATLRPNVFSIDFNGDKNAEIIEEKYELKKEINSKVIEILRGGGTALDITEAQAIVSGGRGMKTPENFSLLKELASIIPNCAVGASRAAVDAGWIDHQHQVGQTGKVVSPDLYMAFGISGSIQHLAGMSSSKVIVAVNKDPEAPIFKVADYGIVGDLFEVVPLLKEELKKLLSQ